MDSIGKSRPTSKQKEKDSSTKTPRKQERGKPVPSLTGSVRPPKKRTRREGVPVRVVESEALPIKRANSDKILMTILQYKAPKGSPHTTPRFTPRETLNTDENRIRDARESSTYSRDTAWSKYREDLTKRSMDVSDSLTGPPSSFERTKDNSQIQTYRNLEATNYQPNAFRDVVSNTVIFLIFITCAGVSVLSTLYYPYEKNCSEPASFIVYQVVTGVLTAAVSLRFIILTRGDPSSRNTSRLIMGSVFFVLLFSVWMWFAISVLKTSGIITSVFEMAIMSLVSSLVWIVCMNPLTVFARKSKPVFTDTHVKALLASENYDYEDPQKKIRSDYLMVVVGVTITAILDVVSFGCFVGVNIMVYIIYAFSFSFDFVSIVVSSVIFHLHRKRGLYIGYRAIFITLAIHLSERIVHVSFVGVFLAQMHNGNNLLKKMCGSKTDVSNSALIVGIIFGIFCCIACVVTIVNGVLNFRTLKKKEAMAKKNIELEVKFHAARMQGKT